MKGSKVTFDAILSQTRQYYDKKLDTYGLSPKGVDWNFSRFVVVLHDYPLYEFTILVKKEVD
jgi:hypothetical protein